MIIFLSEKRQSQQKNTNLKTELTAANRSHKNSKLGQILMQKLIPAGESAELWVKALDNSTEGK